jgi:hypothetical protein
VTAARGGLALDEGLYVQNLGIFSISNKVFTEEEAVTLGVMYMLLVRAEMEVREGSGTTG